MALNSYSNLMTAVAGWLDRTDTDAPFEDWLDMAEAEFQRSVRHRKMVARATATFDAQYTQLPAADPPGVFLEMINLQINASTPYHIQYVTPQRADEERERLSSSSDDIEYFKILGELIELIPTPTSTGITGELAYYKKIPALSSAPGYTENWLLTNHPDLYLYGVLRQSASYLREDERLPVWEAQYRAAFQALQSEERRATMYGPALRIKTTSFG